MDVSIIIPCFNAEEYLAQCVGSVLEQTRPPAEVIVVDDGSTDGSLDVARRFGGRIQLLTGPNRGAPAARNRGARHASGEALMFLDADDVLAPDAIEALVAALESNPGSIAACPWYRLEYVAGRWVQKPASCPRRGPDDDHLAGWLKDWFHPPCSILWSRHAYERVGSWQEGLTNNQDGHLMMQALARGIRLVLTEEGAAFYRRLRPQDQASVSSRQRSQRGLADRLWVVEQVAQTLVEEDALDRYTHALDHALERLERESRAAHPELAHRARNLAAQYAGYPWVRTYRRAKRTAGGHVRAARRLKDRILAVSRNDSEAPSQAPEPVEIRYGLMEGSGR